MRKIVCIEDGDPIQGRVINDMALNWTDNLPLVWQFGHVKIEDVLGHASDIRREENGRITAEIVFNETTKGQQAKEGLENGDLACTIWANKIDEVILDGVQRVKSATVREISVVPATDVPWGRYDQKRT